MAGPIPPRPDPMAPGVCVKKLILKAATPFLTTSIKILDKGTIASMTHNIANTLTTLSTNLRREDRLDIISWILSL
jgi:hypothetical protein